MNRAELITKLETVSPALADESSVSGLGKYWFTGSRLMAYNDQIAISVPLQTDWKGTVPRYVVPILKSIGLDDVELIGGNGTLQIKAGKHNSKVPLGPQDEIAFEMPQTNRRLQQLSDESNGHKAGLRVAMQVCLLSVSDDISRPEYLGVTVSISGNNLLLFSTNGKTLSHARVPSDSLPRFNRRVILPTQFCQQIARLLDGEESVGFGVFDDHALLTVGKTVVWGRLIVSERSFDYERVFNEHAPEERMRSFQPIPETLANVLERAIVIADAKGITPRSALSLNQGKLTITAATERGESRDVLSFAQRDSININTNPKHIRDGLNSFQLMMLSRASLVMATEDKNRFFLVAATAG